MSTLAGRSVTGLPGHRARRERPPFIVGEYQDRALPILGVPHRDDAWQVRRDFDAVAAVARAVRRLAPCGLGQVHCCTTSLIRAVEARGGMASALIVS